MTTAARRAAAIDRGPRPPGSITKLQLYRQAQAADIWDTFATWLAADADRAAEWDLAVEIRIGDELTATAAEAMGMSESDLDTFFREAAKR